MGTQLTNSTGVGCTVHVHVGLSQPIPSCLRPGFYSCNPTNHRSEAALGGAVGAGPRLRSKGLEQPEALQQALWALGDGSFCLGDSG